MTQTAAPPADAGRFTIIHRPMTVRVGDVAHEFQCEVQQDRGTIHDFEDIVSGGVHKLFLNQEAVRTVVDMGANYGASVLFFGCHYPQARVIGFEPVGLIFASLARNVASLRNAEVHNVGLWDRDGEERIKLGNSLNCSSIYDSVFQSGAEVPITLRHAETMLAELEVADIDILKVDTEGCELPILRTMAHRLPRVKVIHLEYHSEADRLELDRMLSPHFVLAASQADFPHLGQVQYVNHRVMERSRLGRFAFTPPEHLNA